MRCYGAQLGQHSLAPSINITKDHQTTEIYKYIQVYSFTMLQLYTIVNTMSKSIYQLSIQVRSRSSRARKQKSTRGWLTSPKSLPSLNVASNSIVVLRQVYRCVSTFQLVEAWGMRKCLWSKQTKPIRIPDVLCPNTLVILSELSVISPNRLWDWKQIRIIPTNIWK